MTTLTISGNINIQVPGNPVAGPTVNTGPGLYVFSAAPQNVGLVFLGNDGNGSVSQDTGMHLRPGDFVYLWVALNLGSVFFDGEQANDKVYYLRVAGMTQDLGPSI